MCRRSTPPERTEYALGATKQMCTGFWPDPRISGSHSLCRHTLKHSETVAGGDRGRSSSRDRPEQIMFHAVLMVLVSLPLVEPARMDRRPRARWGPPEGCA